MAFNFDDAFIGTFFTKAQRAAHKKTPKKKSSKNKSAVITKDDLTPLLQQVQFVVGPEGRKLLLQSIQIQTAGDNIRNFTNEEYADSRGQITKWDKFKKSTLYRNKQDASKGYNRRPSGAKYSAQSKLVQDTGAIRNSIGSIRGKGYNKRLAKTTKLYTEYGTSVSYAGKQNEMRTLLGIANTTWKKIYNIIYKGMGVTKR